MLNSFSSRCRSLLRSQILRSISEILSSIETRSAPAFARRYPRDFTFYLGNPFPRLKLARLPLSLVATLATLPSISEIPFLDSCVPD